MKLISNLSGFVKKALEKMTPKWRGHHFKNKPFLDEVLTSYWEEKLFNMYIFLNLIILINFREKV